MATVSTEIQYVSLEIEYNKTKTFQVNIGDCIYLTSGNEEEPYVGKVCKLFENPNTESNKKMITTKWFYRPGNFPILQLLCLIIFCCNFL
jgi:hypothetical protein